MDSSSLLSTVRAEWCEKDLCAELGHCHQRTVKRWWKKLNCPPDKRFGGRGAMHLWTQDGAARLVSLWRAWWTQHGHVPELQSQKFSGALPVHDPNQLHLNFEKQISQSSQTTGRNNRT